MPRTVFTRLVSQSHWQPAWFVLLAVLVGGVLAVLPPAESGPLLLRTAVLILTLIEPLAGLFAALLTGPLGATESGLLDSGQFYLLFSLLAWLAHGLRQRRLFVPRTFLAVPLALFVGIAAVTVVDAPSYNFGLKELLKWGEMLAIMLLVVDRVVIWQEHRRAGGTKPIIWLLAALFAAGLSQAVLGIYQFGLRGDGPEHFLVLDQFYRAYGTFNQPNPYGGFMNLTAVLGLGIFLSFMREIGDWRLGRINLQSLISNLRSLNWLLVFGVGLVTAVALMAVIFSWSRGAWLSLAAAAAVLVLFWPRKLWQGALLLVVGAGLLLGGSQVGLVPASVTERITSFGEDMRFGDVRGEDITDENYAVLERLAHWQAALGMATDQPWLGMGFGNYEPAYADYALINWPYPLGHAHNYYLNLLAETGIVGLVAYLGLWTAVFWQTIRVIRHSEGWQRGVALGLLGVWTALTVHHLVDKLYVNNIYIQLGALFGLLQLLDETNLNRNGREERGQERQEFEGKTPRSLPLRGEKI
ncbi:MAG: O-antigen ligase family protein [Anaerolineaceae bacterium]|nr:O-antigen ligase family protein [Anaerolineaceae bacterium]